MADWRCDQSALQRGWRGRLPAERPDGVECGGWHLLVRHVEGGQHFTDLARETRQSVTWVRGRCNKAAMQMQQRLQRARGVGMAEGTIRTIRDDRGFGFIRPDGERDDIFFHAEAGERVEFEAGSDPRNPSRRRAERVRPLD